MSMTMYREEDGSLPKYAWPGGYPLIYFTRDGLTVCAECANKEVDDSQAVVGQDVYWEGDPIVCEDCAGLVESAYGPVGGMDDD